MNNNALGSGESCMNGGCTSHREKGEAEVVGTRAAAARRGEVGREEISQEMVFFPIRLRGF